MNTEQSHQLLTAIKKHKEEQEAPYKSYMKLAPQTQEKQLCHKLTVQDSEPSTKPHWEADLGSSTYFFFFPRGQEETDKKRCRAQTTQT